MKNQKIVIPSMNPGGLNAQFDWRFGRCSHFTVIEKEDDKITQVTVLTNDAVNAMGGAGIAASQTVGNLSPSDIIVGNVGPNAIYGLGSIGANLYQVGNNQVNTVKDVLDLFEQGKLQPVNTANVDSHTGMGGGRGMGRGMGRGQSRW
ncbi:MAG: dinitrogenase iron-molybdenum cofactor biosynthesis protein [Candidatus Lokiarchaeota archaeon]|nr:dinitrogenase iron-molybdenum cofactor biosynthesis protein [Candidatus Lokiarchaeota archaeon]